MRARPLLTSTALALGAGAALTRAAQPRPAIHDMAGRVVLVTGANSGIGLEACVALARGGARVLATARDPGRGRAAVTEVRRRADGAGQVELVSLDLASLDSVRACAAEVRDRVDRLDVLVHNAGGVVGTRQETADGFEMTLGVNHLGPFRLTHDLAPLLGAGAPGARVVTVSSLAHRRGALDLDDLLFERRPYSSMAAYAASKLANVLFARELARRLAPVGVTSNALHPGTVRSGFARDGEGHWLLRLGVRVAAPLFVDAERGASTTVHLAASPDVDGLTGQYLSRRRVVRPAPAASDDELARALWQRSAELVGVAPDWPEALALTRGG